MLSTSVEGGLKEKICEAKGAELTWLQMAGGWDAG
jgi:hypothetical protein